MRLRQPTFVEESRCLNVVSAIQLHTVNAPLALVRNTNILKTKRSASSAAQAVMANVQLAPLVNIDTATAQISAFGAVRVQLGIAQLALVRYTKNDFQHI
jgi:hypothetical protein